MLITNTYNTRAMNRDLSLTSLVLFGQRRRLNGPHAG